MGPSRVAEPGFPRHMARYSFLRFREENISALPVDPIALAEARGIEVIAKSAEAKGVSGMLISIPGQNEFVIAYATHIDNEGFKRFSIAHELGHFILDGHCDHLLSHENIHYSRAGFMSGDKYEREADHFAAGLLMPEPLFSPAMERAGSGFQAIQTLKDQFVTSITATANIASTACTIRAIESSARRWKHTRMYNGCV